ncbi:hypothetical protein D3C72_1391240 [compost metagenome]
MSIGYAALAQLLTINGTANISASWDVKISDIKEGTLTGAVSKTAAVVAGDKLSASFDVDLQYPGSSATYIVTVQNAGSIDARLESITGIETANAAAPTELSYSIDAVENDLLANGSTKDYIITVTWADSNQIPVTKTKTATITLNYVQAM